MFSRSATALSKQVPDRVLSSAAQAQRASHDATYEAASGNEVAYKVAHFNDLGLKESLLYRWRRQGESHE